MPQILDADSNVIQNSRNLAGIRRYVGKHIIASLGIIHFADGSGLLRIRFENGNRFITPFASFHVLKDFVRRWRNVQGCPLTVNGITTEWSEL